MTVITNKHGLPDALVRAVQNDPYSAGQSDVSVTSLIDAPQRRVLKRKHDKEISVDVSERMWALTGQAMHHILERAETNALVEQRLFANVNGWILSGQFDRLHLGTKTLQDYKFCKTYKAGGDDAWIRQLNVLRWLLAQHGHEVEHLQIVAIFRDWSRNKARREPTYPQQEVQVIDIPMWPLDETYEYICERIAVHQAAQAGQTVPCTDEERWYTGTKYALVKPGAKRALRVVDDTDPAVVTALTQEAADRGYLVDVRHGEFRRCMDYCEVSPFCSQWKHMQDTLKREQEELVDATTTE